MELILENISKTFGKKQAVKNINLILKPGIHALLGANGSGKTTLMRMIVGILKGNGSIHLDEINVLSDYSTYASYLGYMPQHFGYYPDYTVQQFLEYMAVVKGLHSQYSQPRIQALIKEFHLEEQTQQKLKTLSGGMLRRVGIIQALLNEPKLLILDEPTVGLDPKERMVFMNYIVSLSETTIVLLSTHIVSDIESIADDILIMKEGEIILHDAYDELLKVIKRKVWEVRLPLKEAKELMNQKRVVKSHKEKNLFYLRVVSEEKPHQDAVMVNPCLDDLYLYYFEEEVYHEGIVSV